MPTSLQLDVPTHVLSSDMPALLSCSCIQFSQGSRFLARPSLHSKPFGSGTVRLSQPCHPTSCFDLYFQGERHFRVPVAPGIVDFAVELDSAIYNSRKAALTDDLPRVEMQSLDIDLEFLPFPSPFLNPVFESSGTFLYTQYALEHPWEPEQVLFTANTVASTPLPVDDGLKDAYGEYVAACPRGRPPNDRLVPLATQPVSKVAAAPSPTPSLSHSHPSTSLSSPSPESLSDDDDDHIGAANVEVEEDSESESLVCSPFIRSKRTVRALGALPAKKQRTSAALSPPFSSGAVRFPCAVPGCRQVCKTVGDLKRHQSSLAHQPPSWMCRRCGYLFTREDALKRHTKNLPNCASTKVRPRGRAASIMPQQTASGVEAV